MSDYKKCITDRDSFYFFFEAIKNTHPNSILDIGMFLKRIGALSRGILSYSIPEDILLDGVDCMPEVEVPIYHSIYNSICSLEDFLTQKKRPDISYDMISFLFLEPICSKEQIENLCKWIMGHCTYAICEPNPAILHYFSSYQNVFTITLNQSAFYIVQF